MYTYNEETHEIHVYCDRCSKELLENVVIMTSGDVLCEECFEKEHKVISVEDYIKDIAI